MVQLVKSLNDNSSFLTTSLHTDNKTVTTFLTLDK